VVTGLLLRSEAAVDQGYSGGISTSQVMEQYGVKSGIWQAFFELDSQELAYFAENGTQAGKPPQLAQVSQMCSDYGA
jgi:hypothetical protein